MAFDETIRRMMGAVAAGEAEAAAACFTPDGVYHDVFYGAFSGRDEIARMFREYFYRDGENFLWRAHDPVAAGDVGYARYTFSFDSKLPAHAGRRAMFEGVAICRLRDGLIHDYREVANAATGLRMIGFGDARLARFIDRETAELTGRSEMAEHARKGA